MLYATLAVPLPLNYSPTHVLFSFTRYYLLIPAHAQTSHCTKHSF